MNKNLLPIHFAPLQGYTDAAYRQAHACIFGGIDTYYSPFVRVEHGEIRRKDIRDINPENNRNIHLIPQLIAPQPIMLEQIVSLFIKHPNQSCWNRLYPFLSSIIIRKQTSIWGVLSPCWPNGITEQECCRIPKK